MQMLNRQKTNKKHIRKSHLLVFGSFLVFLGIVLVSCNHLMVIKNIVFSDMQIAISDRIPNNTTGEVVIETPNAEEINTPDPSEEVRPQIVVNYDKYLGVLTIPKIGLKRGFYGLDSKLNSIDHNVTMVKGSALPNVSNSNLILMAHSGNTYLGFFAYLYQLQIGNDAYITYNRKDYHYKLVNIYNVPKDGRVKIVRDYSKTTLTLITCTKDDLSSQTVYIFELV